MGDADIESDGVWNDTKTATQIADWAITQSMSGGLALIRNNIAGWKLSTGVPAFEKYVDNFWWRNYGLGTCDKEREGEVKKNQNAASVYADKYFICRSNLWYVATTLEYDTYEKKCDEDGKIVLGSVNKSQPYDCDGKSWRAATEVEGKLGGCIEKRFNEVAEALETHYICENREWRVATDLEKDTYKWKEGKDADVKTGDVVKSNCYVYENSAWRNGSAKDCLLGLRGCTVLRQDTVGLGMDGAWYKCVSKNWRTATNIEKDTATWGAGDFDGEIRLGQINKTIYYIYEVSKKVWRNATTIEKDTYNHKNNTDWTNGIDGELKKGAVTDTIYVFDKTAWRIADNIEKMLGGCVTAIQDSVGKVGSTYYICKPRLWTVATEIQYDTYKQECSEFGQIVHGNVNNDYAYFCYGEEWKHFYGNEFASYGKLVDERDGQIYRTVKIGEQTWMAENLNYEDSSSVIYGEYDYSYHFLDSYGRFYNWYTAMNPENPLSCPPYPCRLKELSYKVQGACPRGWHLPVQTEWNSLLSEVGMAAKSLKSGIGWADEGNGTDTYGFSALPVGSFGEGEGVGWYARFWSYTDFGENDPHFLELSYNQTSAQFGAYKYTGISIRCIKDEDE